MTQSPADSWDVVGVQEWAPITPRSEHLSRTASVENMNTENDNQNDKILELESVVRKLEKALAEEQLKVQDGLHRMEDTVSGRTHLWATCDTLRDDVKEKDRQIQSLQWQLDKERERYERNSASDREHHAKLEKEMLILGEDLYTLRSLFDSAEGRRRPTLLEETLRFEERVLSLLVRGDVRKTYMRIQPNGSIIMEVEEIGGRRGDIAGKCSLPDSSGYFFKCLTGNERWRGDRLCVRLHFGELVIVKIGEEIALAKSFRDCLLRGTTSAVEIYNVTGREKLIRKLHERAGRTVPQ